MHRRINRFAPPLLFFFGIGALAAACANSDQVACRVGADCPSGVCRADGSCVPEGSTSAGGASSSSASSTGPTTSSTGPGGGGSGGSGACSPNGDGTITREEVPLQAGLHATFKVAENATVNTAGAAQMDGSRIWDLTGALSGDHGELVETLPIAGTWYANDFASATYAARLSDTSDLLGVFEVSATALVLDGIVSPSSGPTQTELKYSPPVTILSFPFHEGSTWMTNTAVSGMAKGVPGVYSEIYTTNVDAHGTLKTPFGDFAALRVTTDLVRTAAGVVTTQRTFAFAAECFGTVGTIVSQLDEVQKEFTNAAEVARLSP